METEEFKAHAKEVSEVIKDFAKTPEEAMQLFDRIMSIFYIDHNPSSQ